MLLEEKGLLVVISGPSGTGKGTVCKKLYDYCEQLVPSVSVTTRAPRAGETEGVNYFFRSREQFEEMIREDAFLEYANVFQNCYGTPREFVYEQLESGKDILLEIDVQGALQVQKRFAEGVFIFIVPPSMEELKRRIEGRGSETPETLNRRLSGAYKELEAMDAYHYVVVNDDVDEAARTIAAILRAERQRIERNPNVGKKLTEEVIL